jgi:hypothetical protein
MNLNINDIVEVSGHENKIGVIINIIRYDEYILEKNSSINCWLDVLWQDKKITTINASLVKKLQANEEENYKRKFSNLQ